MFQVLRKIWKTGTVTRKLPAEEAPPRYRGRLAVLPHSCDHCGTCAQACPTGAIEIDRQAEGCELTIDYGKCIFCGICAAVCENQAIRMTNDYHLATKNKNDLLSSGH